MSNVHNLERYREAVLAYSPQGEWLPNSLRIRSHGALETFYAPFEYINDSARVVICGITPGMQQARIALSAARGALLAGKPIGAAQQLAKESASFAGAMRSNLIAMLDAVGLANRLGLDSTSELFGMTKSP